jgi:GNAT superfamily N-acetyltransferase
VPDLRLAPEPDGPPADADDVDLLVDRLARRRYAHEYADPGAARSAAERMLERVGDSGRLLAVRSGAAVVGRVLWVAHGEDRSVADVVLDDLSLAPALRGLLVDRARADGAARLTVTVSTGDPVAAALVEGAGFEVAATQMLLPLRPDDDLSPASDVRLDPMDEAEHAAWLAGEVEAYAAERVASGESPAQAAEHSRRQHAELLPDGLTTAHHHFFVARVDGVRVGTLWIGTERPMAFVYDVVVDEAHRRRGHGAGLMRAGARWARERGHHALGLNVFGHNHGARALYDRLGYQVTEQFLGLRL